MGFLSARIFNSNSITPNKLSTTNKKLGIVYNVILDENDSSVKDLTVPSAYIGSIQFRMMDDIVTDSSELPIAYPIDKSFKSLPIKNEVVEIYEIFAGFYGYRRFGLDANPSATGAQNSIDTTFPVEQKPNNLSKEYDKISKTGINRTSNIKKDNSSFGNYYLPQTGIHKLKLYEGDTLIESRFGQSIRFTAYNNPKNEFSPTIIIRNFENSISNQLDLNNSTEEDINRDGSIIVLASNQYQLNFQPGTVDDGGSSDFQTKPDSFTSYPSKLIGDQILINSGRLIFSAKTGEMIFYSKKNYGFISDGGLSIDNKLGIDISVGDNINVVTNDRDVAIHSGNGSIFLGNTELEPLVKGQTLVNLLGELIDEIGNMVFLTPAGPSASGPTNVNKFGSIKSKLNTALSKLNQTS